MAELMGSTVGASCRYLDTHPVVTVVMGMASADVSATAPIARYGSATSAPVIDDCSTAVAFAIVPASAPSTTAFVGLQSMANDSSLCGCSTARAVALAKIDATISTAASVSKSGSTHPAPTIAKGAPAGARSREFTSTTAFKIFVCLASLSVSPTATTSFVSFAIDLVTILVGILAAIAAADPIFTEHRLASTGD